MDEYTYMIHTDNCPDGCQYGLKAETLIEMGFDTKDIETLPTAEFGSIESKCGHYTATIDERI